MQWAPAACIAIRQLARTKLPDGEDHQQADDSTTVLDPTEQVEQGVARIHFEVASELLSRLIEQDPAFVASAVVKLLLAMGYGGVGGRGVTTDPTHDGGIDGVIDQDVLGLSKVYIQAKRYSPNNAVQRPEVQRFVGALSGKADGGVFITTSRFRFARRRVVTGRSRRAWILIDGPRCSICRRSRWPSCRTSSSPPSTSSRPTTCRPTSGRLPRRGRTGAHSPWLHDLLKHISRRPASESASWLSTRVISC